MDGVVRVVLILEILLVEYGPVHSVVRSFEVPTERLMRCVADLDLIRKWLDEIVADIDADVRSDLVDCSDAIDV